MYLKFHTFLIAFLLFITCGFSQQAQTSVNNELATTVFNTPEGKITIYIPNFLTNETISGRIIIEPNGSSERSITKNKSKLQTYKLDFDGISTTLQDSHYSLTKNQPFPMELKLLDEKNKLVASSEIQFPSKAKEKNSSSAFVPGYIVAGETAKIVVSNNGSLANNYISLNNNEVKLLATSETNVFFKTPSNLKGRVILNYKNDTTNLDEEVNVLQLNLSAGKLNLSRGESTQLNIEILGLEGLEEEVPLTILNHSPSNISLEGGNNQHITIQSKSDSFQFTQTISAVQGGGFSISATIKPSENDIEQSANEPLCNCFIDGYSYLISPETCNELGGQCKLENAQIILNDRETQLQNPLEVFHFRMKILLSYNSDIDHIEDDIKDHWDKWDRAKHVKDSLDDLHNDLVIIDKVLDRIPEAYKDKLKNAIDALENANEMISQSNTDEALDQAIIDAQSRLDACKKRISELENLVKQHQKELENLEEEINKLLKDLNKVLDDYCLDNSCLASIKTNKDGTISLDYKIPKEADESTRDYIAEFTSAIGKKIAKHRRELKANEQTLENLKAAKDDCSQLEDALNKAKEAKTKADYKATKDIELEEQCEQLKRILNRLKTWCINHPDHCDFLDDIKDMMERCPKNHEDLDNFWKNFDALIKKKKALEESLAKAAKDAQDDMDKAEDEVTKLENEIAALKEQKQKKDQAEQERKQKNAQAEAEEAAKAKAAADKRKKQRNKQKKEDDKVKDLIKKAKSSEAGDDAFEDLLTGTGLNLLDEVSGKSKLGSIIGGLLAAKDVPDCTCPIIRALRDAIAARNRKEYSTLSSYVDAYLIEWSKCANLPSISSVPIGSTELTDAIKGMTDAQTKKALDALNQAVRVQCE